MKHMRLFGPNAIQVGEAQEEGALFSRGSSVGRGGPFIAEEEFGAIVDRIEKSLPLGTVKFNRFRTQEDLFAAVPKIETEAKKSGVGKDGVKDEYHNGGVWLAQGQTGNHW